MRGANHVLAETFLFRYLLAIIQRESNDIRQRVRAPTLLARSCEIRQLRDTKLPQERAQVVVKALAGHEAVAKPNEHSKGQSYWAPGRRQAKELTDVSPYVSRFSNQLSFRAPVNDRALNLDCKRIPPQPIVLLRPCVTVKCACERDVFEHALRMQGLQSGAELMSILSGDVASNDLLVLREYGFVHGATVQLMSC